MSSAEEASKAAQAAEQPFHEAGDALLAAPQAPSVSNVAARAQERARGVNFRDLHSVSSTVQPGRVYRSSQVVSASELEHLGVSAVLDLRQPPTLCKTEHANLRQAIRSSLLGCLGWLAGRLGGSSGGGRYMRERYRCASDEGPGPRPLPCHRCTSECCEHYGIKANVYHVDLLPTRVSLRILCELPRGIQAKVLWAAARRKHPEPIVAGAVADPEVMGYVKLYHILLERAKPRLAEAMRLFADRANYPLLVHCIHGKDRTGLVAMLLLLLCDVDQEVVIRDYALSEALLREGREKRELLGLQEHLTTDQVIAAAAHVMASTISHLNTKYGSARNYLMSLGLTQRELRLIQLHLTQPGLPLPATAATAACDKPPAG